MSYRHDRRRKLIRRWEREGWTQMGWIEEADFGNIKLSGCRVFAAEPGTLPSVGALEWARHRAESSSPKRTNTEGVERTITPI